MTVKINNLVSTAYNGLYCLLHSEEHNEPTPDLAIAVFNVWTLNRHGALLDDRIQEVFHLSLILDYDYELQSFRIGLSWIDVAARLTWLISLSCLFLFESLRAQ